MNGRRREPRAVVSMALIAVGIILLLPGVCAVVLAVQMIATEDVVRLAMRDPFFILVLMVWGACLVVALGGGLLIRHALRRHRVRRIAS